MAINLSIKWSHPGANSAFIRYARIDNVSNPSYIIVTPNKVVTPNVTTINIAEGVPNGQYEIQATPIYADGRSCAATIDITNACPGLQAISAYISGGNIIVNWTALPEIPKARITVTYPAGGSAVANYSNVAPVNNTVIPIPPGNNGNITVQGQSVCDESSGFYSSFSNSITLNNATGTNPIPSQYVVGNNIDTLCNGNATTLYTNGAFAIGNVIYQDAALTVPVTGYTYVSSVYSLIIYTVSTLTGEVLGSTGQSCNVVVSNNILTDNYKINTVTGITGFVLPGGGVLVNTSYTGTRTPSGTFTVAVNVSSNIGASGRLTLSRNNIVIQCLNVSGNNTYTFNPFVFAANDLLEIESETGSC